MVQEEGARLDMKVKVQEGAGLSLKRSVVKSDLTAGELFPQGDCPLGLSFCNLWRIFNIFLDL